MQSGNSLMEYVTAHKIIDHQENRYNALAEAGVPRNKLQYLHLEVGGGKCPSCDEAWRAIVVKNMYADFTYYAPSCHCHGRCKRCGTWLYGVTEPNAKVRRYRCPSCYFKWPEERVAKTDSKREALKI